MSLKQNSLNTIKILLSQNSIIQQTSNQFESKVLGLTLYEGITV